MRSPMSGGTRRWPWRNRRACSASWPVGCPVDVRVPAAEFGERDLESEVRLDQLRDLLHRFAERRARILGAVGRHVAAGIGALRASSRRRTLPCRWARAACRRPRRTAPRTSTPSCLLAAPARTPNWLSWPIASAGSLPWSVRGSCGASATARNGVAFSCSLRAGSGSASRRACLHARRAALHVVLRVEVRPRLVVRAARVHDRELAALEQRRERRHPRIQPEEAVEIDRAFVLVTRSRNPRSTAALCSTPCRRTARSC